MAESVSVVDMAKRKQTEGCALYAVAQNMVKTELTAVVKQDTRFSQAKDYGLCFNDELILTIHPSRHAVKGRRDGRSVYLDERRSNGKPGKSGVYTNTSDLRDAMSTIIANRCDLTETEGEADG